MVRRVKTPTKDVFLTADGVATRLRIVFRETAAESRLNAEHRKKARRNLESLDLHGRGLPRHVERDAEEPRRLLERVDAIAPADVIDRRDAHALDACRRAALENPDEAIGISIGERSQQHFTRKAEYRGVRAEADRERRDGDGREDRS